MAFQYLILANMYTYVAMQSNICLAACMQTVYVYHICVCTMFEVGTSGIWSNVYWVAIFIISFPVVGKL